MPTKVIGRNPDWEKIEVQEGSMWVHFKSGKVYVVVEEKDGVIEYTRKGATFTRSKAEWFDLMETTEQRFTLFTPSE